MPCQAAIWTMQSQPRNIWVSFGRSKTDASMNSVPLLRCGGARTSRMTGVSPLSSSLGTRACPRFPDPPVSTTFIILSSTYICSGWPPPLPDGHGWYQYLDNDPLHVGRLPLLTLVRESLASRNSLEVWPARIQELR